MSPPPAPLSTELPPPASPVVPEPFLAFRQELGAAAGSAASASETAAPPRMVEVAGMGWTVPLFFAWLVLASIGSVWMLRYQLTPAASGIASSDWPAESMLVRAGDRPTLLMFVHPHCPCSRASVAELHKLVRASSAAVDVELVFFSPAEADVAWVETDLWSDAQRIPGAHCVVDPDGREHRLFGARTSGETLLFSPDGTLRFQGGLTPARGEEGDNVGRRTLTTLLHTDQILDHRTPVFGCSLDAASGSAPRTCCQGARKTSVAHWSDASTPHSAK